MQTPHDAAKKKNIYYTVPTKALSIRFTRKMVQSKFVSSSNPILRVTAVVPARAKDHFVVSTNNNKETEKKSHCHIIEVINNDLISFLKGAEMM